MTLSAGAARTEITPEPGVELMGYGARVGTAVRCHDPLCARALCLSRTACGEESEIIIVSADLCLVTPEQAQLARGEISARTRVPVEHIQVCCTHTHSGPDTGLGARMTGREEPPSVKKLFDGIVDAAVQAHRGQIPASLRWTRADAHIGRNRRLAAGPLDPEVRILQVEERSGRPLAVLFNYACHGTVLGHDNLEISADWPGVASARIEAERGGVALFQLGAHADVDPRTRGLMDLAIEGQSLGLGFDAVRVLGGEVAEAVLTALDAPGDENAAAEVSIGAASSKVSLAAHLGELDEREVQARLEAQKRAVAGDLGIPLERFPRSAELYAAVQSRARELPPSAARELISRARLYVRDRTVPRWLDGRRRVEVEVQVLAVAGVALLGLPLEPTTDVGLDWKSRAAGGCVAGIANGWLRYLPHRRDLEEPLAHQRYEILSSLFEPDACERLLAEGERLRASLSDRPAGP
jgi:hypothetical protein